MNTYEVKYRYSDPANDNKHLVETFNADDVKHNLETYTYEFLVENKIVARVPCNDSIVYIKLKY